MPETFFISSRAFSCCRFNNRFCLINVSNLYVSKWEFNIPHSTFNIEFFAPQKTLGGYCGGVPPLSIPNREVKPACADGTAMQCGRVGGCLLYFGSSRSNDFGDLFLCPYISYFLLFTSLFLDIACAEHYLCPCYTLLYSSVLWLVYIPF